MSRPAAASNRARLNTPNIVRRFVTFPGKHSLPIETEGGRTGINNPAVSGTSLALAVRESLTTTRAGPDGLPGEQLGVLTNQYHETGVPFSRGLAVPGTGPSTAALLQIKGVLRCGGFHRGSSDQAGREHVGSQTEPPDPRAARAVALLLHPIFLPSPARSLDLEARPKPLDAGFQHRQVCHHLILRFN